MKKYIFSLLITSTIVLSGYGLATVGGGDNRDRVHLGAKIGLNLSNVYNTSGDNFVADSKFGMAVGAFTTLPFGKLLAFQPEIMLSQKGFKGNGQLLGSPYSLTRTTTFIDVPLFFAVRPTGFLTLLIGPQYSYLVKQKDEFGSGPNSYLQEQEFKNDNIHKNILCVVSGADINIDHFIISARAGWDVQKNNGDGSSATPQYKNVWYQATVGFRVF
jgi:hypothetical protein